MTSARTEQLHPWGAGERRRHVKEQIAGPWAWREYLPPREKDLPAFRFWAATKVPPGVNLGRFLKWVEAEVLDPPAAASSRTLARYRRALFDLWRELDVERRAGHEGHEGDPAPAATGDEEDLEDLPPAELWVYLTERGRVATALAA